MPAYSQVGERLWKEKDGEEKPWLPLEIWHYILTFLRRKNLSSIRAHVATGGAVASRTAGSRRSGNGGGVSGR